MNLAPLDWIVVAAYAALAVFIGVRYARRAGQDVNEFFLAGRSLPWWIAGTSMVATTFAADTPLVISGWVRDFGIWKNWLWWCYAAGGMLTVFVFVRYWRRGEVMTTAELAELRYGGRQARVLRGFLGVYHAGITNTMVLCWVLLAAAKIMDVLLGVDKGTALVLACALSLSYSLLAGFWGVVLTDLVQFTMAMVGALILAALSWSAVGGSDAILEAARTSSAFRPDTLALFPAVGDGGIFDAAFWTRNAATVAVYMGVAWWAVESVDGGGTVVQRISATRGERDGVLAALWYNIAHYALRPWPWILVALASLIVLPPVEVTAPAAGVVREVTGEEVVLTLDGGEERRIALEEASADWRPLAIVAPEERVAVGTPLARTDSERAYVVMMARFLPVGILGLVVASLLAAFMSTIDTHVNLASSFFVNDVWRRFLAPGRDAAHYVRAARISSAVVLVLGGLFAASATSISGVFQFFLAFLGGVGPVYVLRWLWWRVRASTEITAMIASSVLTVALTHAYPAGWPGGPLTPDGILSPEARLVLVALGSLLLALISMGVTRRPDPASLVPFYERVRPLGAWGPVRRLAGVPGPPAREALAALAGTLGGVALVWGVMLGVGLFFLNRSHAAAWALACAVVGAILVHLALRASRDRPVTSPGA